MSRLNFDSDMPQSTFQRNATMVPQSPSNASGSLKKSSTFARPGSINTGFGGGGGMDHSPKTPMAASGGMSDMPVNTFTNSFAGETGGGGGGAGGGGGGETNRDRSASNAGGSPPIIPPPTPTSSSGSSKHHRTGHTGAISNMHQHHYHYHLYQTTITETAEKKEDAEDEHDEAEDAELAELMELFPDGIPEELLMDDGSGVPQEVVDENGLVITVIRPRQKPMKNIFGVHDLSQKDLESLTPFAKVYRFLHDPSSSFWARLWSILMVLAIVTSSVMILLQSMPNLRFLDSIEDITLYVEFYSVCLFTVDYLLKLFSVHSYADCVLPKPLPYNVLVKFCTQPLNVLDFISVVPFWVQYVLGDGATSGNSVSLIFRIIRMTRIVRLLKVAQYSRSIDIFFRVIVQAWDALLLLLFFVGFGSIIFGTLIYLCESGVETPFYDADTNTTTFKFMRDNILGNAKEETPFKSIPLSFWYVVTTLTTVGYGDLVPTSSMGKLVGGFTMLSGVIFVSVPLVIFGTHFQNEFTKELNRLAFVHKRQEKIKKKQEAKAKEDKRKAKEEADARIAAGGSRFDEGDVMAAAMGLGGSYELPGAVPPSPSVKDSNDDLVAPIEPSKRPFAARGSIMVRGSTFAGGSRGSIMGGGMLGGMMPGQLGSDVSIRVNDAQRGSVMGGPGGSFLQPITARGPIGGSMSDSGCICPCTCGARANTAAGLMPGSDVVGGVRRNTILKTGGRMSMVGPSILSNPTAADNLAVQKGMAVVQQVLPPKDITERSAQSMAHIAGTTVAGNMSSSHIMEMQAQMEALKVLVAQLGGLLIAGGAPAPAIANAMISSVMPSADSVAAKLHRKSIKAQSVLEKRMAEESAAAAAAGLPLSVVSAANILSSPKASLQPSSGKLGVAASPAAKPVTATAATPASTIASPVTSATPAGPPSLSRASTLTGFPAAAAATTAPPPAYTKAPEPAFALPPAVAAPSVIGQSSGPSSTSGIIGQPAQGGIIGQSGQSGVIGQSGSQPAPAAAAAAPSGIIGQSGSQPAAAPSGIIGQSGNQPAAASGIIGQSGNQPAASGIIGQSGNQPTAALSGIIGQSGKRATLELMPLSSPSASSQPLSPGGISLASPSGTGPAFGAGVVVGAAAAAATVAATAAPAPAPVPAPAPAPVKPPRTGPIALSVDAIIPDRPVHVFPPAAADESTIECTTRMLSSLLDTPKLTEKLLLKPPFRLLHDLVTSMIRVHGFPSNYFDSKELDPNNLVEIAPKLEFLDKLIDLLSIINQSELSHVNTKKIVAGLEWENTNLMMQELAKAAASGITVDQITQMMLDVEEAAAAEEAGLASPSAGAAPGESPA